MKMTPPPHDLMDRYLVLCRYVGLTEEDIGQARSAWPVIRPHVSDLVDDFYARIEMHPEAAAAITGGEEQVARLKATLGKWIEELFNKPHNRSFVENRWLVGLRHVQIGLPQMWAAAAMSRLRDQIIRHLAADKKQSTIFPSLASSITRLMDLDLALIQDAYSAESVAKHLRSEHAFAEAIIGTTESIVLLLDNHGKILRGNAYVARLVCGNDQLPTELDSIDALIPADDVGAIKQLLVTDKEAKESTGPAITNLVDASGRRRHVRWFSKSILQPGEEDKQATLARLLVGHDVTEFLEAQRRAIQHERLAAIGQTMAGLAHESRNAFQRSQASLETLALEVNDRPVAVELIERIERAHNHLLHLYEEVLQFAKPIVLDLERHRLADVISATWKHITEAKGYATDRLLVDVSEDISDVTCDGFAIEQILRNLIENALAVSSESDPVSVTVRRDWQGNERAIRIEIMDRGSGIAEHHLERIFEPFFSTRSRGSGLGLPIAKRLTEAHGGTLDIISSQQGTTAYVTIPEVAHRVRHRDFDGSTDYRRE